MKKPKLCFMTITFMLVYCQISCMNDKLQLRKKQEVNKDNNTPLIYHPVEKKKSYLQVIWLTVKTFNYKCVWEYCNTPITSKTKCSLFCDPCFDIYKLIADPRPLFKKYD